MEKYGRIIDIKDYYRMSTVNAEKKSALTRF